MNITEPPKFHYHSCIWVFFLLYLHSKIIKFVKFSILSSNVFIILIYKISKKQKKCENYVIYILLLFVWCNQGNYIILFNTFISFRILYIAILLIFQNLMYIVYIIPIIYINLKYTHIFKQIHKTSYDKIDINKYKKNIINCIC